MPSGEMGEKERINGSIYALRFQETSMRKIKIGTILRRKLYTMLTLRILIFVSDFNKEYSKQKIAAARVTPETGLSKSLCRRESAVTK